MANDETRTLRLPMASSENVAIAFRLNIQMGLQNELKCTELYCRRGLQLMISCLILFMFQCTNSRVIAVADIDCDVDM